MKPTSRFFSVTGALAGLIAIGATAQAAQVAISSPAVAPAAAAPASTSNATIPNSSGNYLSDRLSWPKAIEAKATLSGSIADGYCIPAGTKVIGARAAMDTDVQPASGAGSAASASQFQAVTLDNDTMLFTPANANLQGSSGKYYVAGPTRAEEPNACPHVSNPANKFYEGTIAYISSDDMNNIGSRSGWDYGALIVPFKMQMSGAKAFTGSASVGGYFGYENPIFDLGINVTPILFAGASNISTSETTGGTTTSQTVGGLSYGGGLLFELKDSFKMGIVLGFDHVDSTQKYIYNDKPWISLEIGYSFAN